MATVFRSHVRSRARAAGLSCHFDGNKIEICSDDRLLRSDARHAIYTFDLIDNFDFFFEAVEAEVSDGFRVVDYSSPRLHRVRGFDLHPILFPSIAEPLETTEQYLSFAALTDGAVAIDLGAYSGLTSIMLRQRCGADGRVIAVEADQANLAAVRTNIQRYAAESGQNIDLFEGAIWEHNDGITFSSEGSMGSSAAAIIGSRMKHSTRRVPSFTLSALADHFALDRIDFIKCDIEGGEAVIFTDSAFFKRFSPRMIVEVHPVKGEMTTDAVTAALALHGYKIRNVKQDGIDLPLLECQPA